MTIKYNKWPYYIPNGHKINQNFLFPDPPKFIRILIFGLRKYPSGNPGLKSKGAPRRNQLVNQRKLANPKLPLFHYMYM
jgi:hypothetical protein